MPEPECPLGDECLHPRCDCSIPGEDLLEPEDEEYWDHIEEELHDAKGG